MKPLAEFLLPPLALLIGFAIGARVMALRFDELRKRQIFLDTDDDSKAAVGAGIYAHLAGDSGHALLQFDHLGVWLGHLLLGKTERSEGGTDIEVINEAAGEPA